MVSGGSGIPAPCDLTLKVVLPQGQWQVQLKQTGQLEFWLRSWNLSYYSVWLLKIFEKGNDG